MRETDFNKQQINHPDKSLTVEWDFIFCQNGQRRSIEHCIQVQNAHSLHGHVMYSSWHDWGQNNSPHVKQIETIMPFYISTVQL